MDPQERARRLERMLSQILGPAKLESLEMPVAVSATAESVQRFTGAAKSADVATEAAAAKGLAKVKKGQLANQQESMALEALILPDLRPVAYIREGAYTDFTMPIWQHLNAPDVRARLERRFPSIGRVELPLLRQRIPYGGTAFVVGPNLLMTNRHVAQLFSAGIGRKITYQAGSSAIDFKREDVPSTPVPIGVDGVVMVHPFWDMALLKVSGLPPEAKPLPLWTEAPEKLVDREVVVVGYPARDDRSDLTEQDQIFEHKYGVKRLQPGVVRQRSRIRSFENLVDAMTHDSSTLGGNSGSAIIDVQTGDIVGLHFAGEYLLANYAVAMHDLAQDPRVVDSGLSFKGKVSSTTTAKRAWDRIEVVAPAPNADSPLTPSASNGQPQPVTLPASANSATFVIPLQVTISFGTPARPTAAAIDAGHGPIDLAATSDEPSVEKVPVIFPDLESRSGYLSDFLELDDGAQVTLPALTRKGMGVASKADDGSAILKYHRFSLAMHKKRRLALFTAANVDWRVDGRRIEGRKPTRKELNGFTGNEKEDWVNDPRIPVAHQIPDYFYTHDGNNFDRGHLVRREDVAWGEDFEDMQRGNGDTFHMTNCSPQIADFNRPDQESFNWGALESMIQKETKSEKVCIFSGPVFAEEDPPFAGLLKGGVPLTIQIPESYWKIIVAKNDGQPAAYGFVLDQDLSNMDPGVEFAVPDAWKAYLHPLTEIESLLGGLLSIGHLIAWDQYE